MRFEFPVTWRIAWALAKIVGHRATATIVPKISQRPTMPRETRGTMRTQLVPQQLHPFFCTPTTRSFTDADPTPVGIDRATRRAAELLRSARKRLPIETPLFWLW